MAQARLRRPVRHPAGEHPHPQPVPRRRLRLARADPHGPAGARHPGGASWSGRPVKLVLRREQMYGPVGHRAPTRQTLRLGTDGDGRADRARPSRRGRRPAPSTTSSSRPPTPRTRSMPARRSRPRTRPCGSTPARRCFMRAPGEATGSIALESAIDEAAEACGMDPLAFRLRNYAEVEPITGKPFSSKALRECYAQGAERFGWASAAARAPADARRERPARRLGHGHRDLPGPDVPGRGAGRAPRATAPALMETGAHDMGQGAWTALAQIAADGARARHRRRSSSAPAPPTCPMPASPAARPIPRPPAWRSTMPAPTSIAKLADLATGDERSPLFGAGNAGVDRARRPAVSAATTRAAARAMPTSSRRAGLARDRRPRQGRPRPGGAGGLRHARAWRGLRRGEGRSRSRPDPRAPGSSAPSRPAGSSTRGWCAASIMAA